MEKLYRIFRRGLEPRLDLPYFFLNDPKVSNTDVYLKRKDSFLAPIEAEILQLFLLEIEAKSGNCLS